MAAGKAACGWNMSDFWYFAYGSNLATDQMVQRTGDIREARRARLLGYRLAFNKRGRDGSGKANIVPDPTGIVWGVVYRCSGEALEKMDRWEGVPSGHYVRKIVRVQLDNGDELEAVTYVAGPRFVDDALIPAPEYLEKILRGARHHHLPPDYIRNLQAQANRGDAAGGHHPG